MCATASQPCLAPYVQYSLASRRAQSSLAMVCASVLMYHTMKWGGGFFAHTRFVFLTAITPSHLIETEPR